MANYSFDLKTEKEIKMAKIKAAQDEKNKFVSRFAIEGPKIEGGHNEILEGFVRGRPVKKSKPIKMPEIPRDYNGKHDFEQDCSVTASVNAAQNISSMWQFCVKNKLTQTSFFE